MKKQQQITLPLPATEVERSVIGVLMTDSTGQYMEHATASGIEPLHFAAYTTAAEVVFHSASENVKASFGLLAQKMKSQAKIPELEIHGFLQSKDVQSFGQHIQTLKDEHIRREEYRISQEFLSKLMDGEAPATAAAELDFQRNALHLGSKNENVTRVDQCMNYLDQIRNARNGKLPTGHKSGLNSLDTLVGGWGTGGRFIIMAARPGMGKSSIAQTICTNLAENKEVKCATALITLEMESKQVIAKYTQAKAGVSRADQRSGRVTDAEMNAIDEAVTLLYELPFFIKDLKDNPGLNTLPVLIQTIRTLSRKYGVRVFMVDYLQLVGDTSKRHQTRDLEVGFVSKTLAAVALTENVDIIALAQLSRAVETRGGDKKPQLSDLRESGSLEQDAGQILFIYRPDYYSIVEDYEGNDLRGVVEVIQAKDRYTGVIGSAFLYYDPKRDNYIDGGLDKLNPDAPRPTEIAVTYSALITTPSAKDEDIPF